MEGRHVRLEPLDTAHGGPLGPIWAKPEVHRFLIGFEPDPGRPDVGGVIDKLLRTQSQGTSLAFTVVLRSDGRPVGVTSFLDIQRPHDKVEIGGTWLDPSVWRTPVHAETKLLLLRHAFEGEGAHRVLLRTDRRDERSQRAIARIGATQEAVLREHLWLSEGFYRDSVYFRILRPEWPRVEALLRERLARLDAREGASRGSAEPPTSSPVAPPRAPVERPPTEMGFREPVTLTGRHVELAPLERRYAPELERAGQDRAVWQYMRWGGERPARELIEVILTELLGEQARGTVLPFVILVLPDRRVSGVFRFLNIDRPNRGVELGTWVDPAYWRSPVNTEVKYLALKYAFERERARRVQLSTDARNERSQRAIERLGAVREGRHDEHTLLPDGHYRTSIVYSILETEWPTVKSGLERKLAAPWAPPEPSPVAHGIRGSGAESPRGSNVGGQGADEPSGP
jgi:N-acetyltransferase